MAQDDVSDIVVRIIGQLGSAMDVKVKDISDPVVKAEITALLKVTHLHLIGKLVKRL